jgi:hypothetical protein
MMPLCSSVGACPHARGSPTANSTNPSARPRPHQRFDMASNPSSPFLADSMCSQRATAPAVGRSYPVSALTVLSAQLKTGVKPILPSLRKFPIFAAIGKIGRVARRPYLWPLASAALGLASDFSICAETYVALEALALKEGDFVTNPALKNFRTVLALDTNNCA